MFSHRQISVIDQVTLLSPARIEGRVARDNYTPIVGRKISSGLNVFASGWVLRSAGRKGSGHGGSDARASKAPPPPLRHRIRPPPQQRPRKNPPHPRRPHRPRLPPRLVLQKPSRLQQRLPPHRPLRSHPLPHPRPHPQTTPGSPERKTTKRTHRSYDLSPFISFLCATLRLCVRIT